MPFCPHCRWEFKPEITVCSDCGSELVAELQPLPEKAGSIRFSFKRDNEKLLKFSESLMDKEWKFFLLCLLLYFFLVPSSFPFVHSEILRSDFTAVPRISFFQLVFQVFRFLIEGFIPAFFIGFSYCYLTGKRWSYGMRIFVIGSLVQFLMLLASYHGFVTVYKDKHFEVITRVMPNVILLFPFFSFLLGEVMGEKRGGIEKHENFLAAFIFSIFVFNFVRYVLSVPLFFMPTGILTKQWQFILTLEEYLPYLLMGLFLGYFFELKSLLIATFVLVAYNFVTQDIQFAVDSGHRLIFYQWNKFLFHILSIVVPGVLSEYFVLFFKNAK